MGRKIINFFSDVYYTVEASHAMLILIKVKTILCDGIVGYQETASRAVIPKLCVTVSGGNYFYTYFPVFIKEGQLFCRCHIMA
jgi:hypothetical protein